MWRWLRRALACGRGMDVGEAVARWDRWLFVLDYICFVGIEEWASVSGVCCVSRGGREVCYNCIYTTFVPPEFHNHLLNILHDLKGPNLVFFAVASSESCVQCSLPCCRSLSLFSILLSPSHKYTNHSQPMSVYPHFKRVRFRDLLVYSASPQLSKRAESADDLATGCAETVALCFSSVLKSLKILYNGHVYWANATEKGLWILMSKSYSWSAAFRFVNWFCLSVFFFSPLKVNIILSLSDQL